MPVHTKVKSVTVTSGGVRITTCNPQSKKVHGFETSKQKPMGLPVVGYRRGADKVYPSKGES